MNIVYAYIITLAVHPIVGTFLFILIEKLELSIKLKILILTFAHPLLSEIVIWPICSIFNSEIAKSAVFLIAGSFVWTLFSDRKYFLNLTNESGIVTIDYVTQLLKVKKFKIAISEIKDFKQSKTRYLIDKPSELTITLSEEDVLRFKILDKNREVSL